MKVFQTFLRPTLTMLILLAMVPWSHSAQDSASLQRIDKLDKSVQELPQTSPDQKLKKATLLWAMEDAHAAQAAGSADRAEVTLHDVETLLPLKIGVAHPAPPNLFPRKPEYQITTYPPAGSLERSGRKNDRTALAYLLQGTYKKGPEGDIIRNDTDGWVAIKIAYEAETLAMALCHPESPYAGDPKLIAPMFRRFENAYEYMVPDNKKRLADFGPTPPLSQMYLLLKTVYPDLILPSRQAAWEKAIRLNCDTILESRETLFAEAKPGTAYVNCDVKYISGLAYAGVLFNDPRYKKAAENGVRLMETAIYPDGASAYIGWQNEVPTYHPILVTELARIAQVTGNPLAIDLVKRTANYYPLSFVITKGDRGIHEFSTASSWKQNWNGCIPGESAKLVEHYSGRPQTVPPSEKYFVYDRNIEGPRGRFGGFAFCGTARDYHGDLRGKNTYVGCMAMTNDGLSAALGTVGTQVKPVPGATGVIYNLSQNEHNATTVTRDFAALTTTHNLNAYKGRAAEWQGRQAWLFTPNRLVGLVCVESLKPQQACSIDGVLQFVTTFNSKKDEKGIKPIGGDTFSTGLLNTKFHRHDYEAIEAESAPSKFTHITLLDKEGKAAGGNKLVQYAKGAEHFYLVEIYPEWAKPAESVTLLALPGGVAGFEVREAGKPIRVIFNPTEAPLVYRCEPNDSGLQLHRNGEQYRPVWIGKDGREEIDGAPADIASADVARGISIPAYAHIVITSGAK